jgi:hypothetical protein
LSFFAGLGLWAGQRDRSLDPFFVKINIRSGDRITNRIGIIELISLSVPA